MRISAQERLAILHAALREALVSGDEGKFFALIPAADAEITAILRSFTDERTEERSRALAEMRRQIDLMEADESSTGGEIAAVEAVYDVISSGRHRRDRLMVAFCPAHKWAGMEFETGDIHDSCPRCGGFFLRKVSEAE